MKCPKRTHVSDFPKCDDKSDKTPLTSLPREILSFLSLVFESAQFKLDLPETLFRGFKLDLH